MAPHEAALGTGVDLGAGTVDDEVAVLGAEQDHASTAQFFPPYLAHCASACCCTDSLFPPLAQPTTLPSAATLAQVRENVATTWHCLPPCFVQYRIAIFCAVA